MWFLRPHTFDHEPFRRGKQDMYPITKMNQFDADFCMQLHFNFLAQHRQPRNRIKGWTLLVRADSVMLILMLSRRIPLPCQSYQASDKNFLAMFWKTFWTAPLVADSLCVLWRKTTMTISVDTIRILRKLSKET